MEENKYPKSKWIEDENGEMRTLATVYKETLELDQIMKIKIK